jgi:hypothetical protein
MDDLISVSQSGRMACQKVEISVRGKWVEVPALWVNGQAIVVTGKRIRIASFHDEEWLEEELKDPAACLKRLKEHSGVPQADIFCFAQKVPSTEPRYSYPAERRSVAVADISSFKEWWESLPQETRKNVRRSQKRGVVLKVRGFDSDVIKGIAEIQNESPIRQGRRYSHFGKSFDQVKRDHGAFLDRSDFICAYCGEEFIGCLKLVYRGDIASILQLNSKAAHYDKRPSNALIAKAAELCAAKGISHLIYGKFNYWSKGHSPLREFKERHGFREMLVPTYYVPLTVWGRVCVKLKLYRGPLSFVPTGVLSKALDVRARWYNRRNSSKPV